MNNNNPVLIVNRSSSNDRVMVQCAITINREAVRREKINGIEHIIVSSATLPDNIIMNGGLYPADEIEKSYQSLELTLAPLGHPQIEGQYVSASDPRAINEYHVGAFNMNVRRENGRVFIDKYINVNEANTTAKGRELLDRIGELETNDNARPIHTSVGVFTVPEMLDEPVVNEDGTQYSWVARDMVFDHDAILLSEPGAARPDQGVGMAVNKNGMTLIVNQFRANTVAPARDLPLAPSDTEWNKSEADKRVRAEIGAEDEPNATYKRYHLWYDADNDEEFGAYKLPFVDIIDGEVRAIPNALRNAASRLDQVEGPSDDEKERIRTIIDGYLADLRNNASLHEMYSAVEDALRKASITGWIIELLEDTVIFEGADDLFEVPYVVDSNGIATIMGIPVAVDRNVSYSPKTNNDEGDAMRDIMIEALAKAGVTVNADISDAELLAKYNELKDGGDVQTAVNEAIKPLIEKVDGLEAKMNEADDTELSRLADLVGNSDKFPGLTVDAAKTLDVETLKSMAANVHSAFGVSPVFSGNNDDTSDAFTAPTEMPQ